MKWNCGVLKKIFGFFVGLKKKPKSLKRTGFTPKVKSISSLNEGPQS